MADRRRGGLSGTGIELASLRILHAPAAIAAVHSQAASAAATDWSQIVLLYGALARIDSSPVVELNRAVAIAMRDGPEAGLRLIDALVAAGELAGYHLAHTARADLCRRLGKTAEARSSYEKALALTQQEPERRFLENRLKELKSEDACRNSEVLNGYLLNGQ